MKLSYYQQMEIVSHLNLKANKVSEYFYKDNDKCDFSNYSQNSYFSDEINKITAENMKDETKYFPIVEIVRLMSKLYSYAKEL